MPTLILKFELTSSLLNFGTEYLNIIRCLDL